MRTLSAGRRWEEGISEEAMNLSWEFLESRNLRGTINSYQIKALGSMRA